MYASAMSSGDSSSGFDDMPRLSDQNVVFGSVGGKRNQANCAEDRPLPRKSDGNVGLRKGSCDKTQ
jgi:hypothetical protein